MANSNVTEKLNACVKAAKRLMRKSEHSPKAEEIAIEAHGGEGSGEFWPVGKEEIDWVRTHLSAIATKLVDEEQLSVCLVNKELYSKFHRRIPATVEAAKSVLPMRGSYRAAGLHFVTSENDTIWLASQGKIGDVGTGAITKVKRNIDRAVNENLLTRRNGQEFIRQLKDKI